MMWEENNITEFKSKLTDNFFEISFPFEKDYLEWVNKKKDAPQVTPQVTDPVSDTVSDTVTEQVKKLILVIGNKELNSGSIRNTLNMKHRNTFFKNYLHPALKQGLIEMTIPDKPNSRNQKYRLTAKGKQLKKLLD